jgi:ribosomal protein L34E
MNRFETLAGINCNDKTEKKNGLTYLSWAWAWDQMKRQYPDSYYTIYESATGCIYHTDGNTCWVKTGVTLVDGDFKLEHIEYLPVMDFKNKSIPLDLITSTDANKAVQRSLTKAVARHGLGLYIYAGEDLPEQEIPINGTPADKPPVDYKPEPPKKAKLSVTKICKDCGTPILGVMQGGVMTISPEDVARQTEKAYGVPVCVDCAKKRKAAK